MGNARETLIQNLEGPTNLGDLSIVKRIVLNWILGCESVDWIHLAQDSVQWLALVSTLIKTWECLD